MKTVYTNDIRYVTSIKATICSECGLVSGLADEFIAARRKDHGTFYCPNGHSQYFPQKNEAEQLRGQLEAARSLANREAQRREAAERQRNAYKGHATRLKNRVAAGKCPCCSEQFPDVAAHVAQAHPGYVEQSQENP